MGKTMKQLASRLTSSWLVEKTAIFRDLDKNLDLETVEILKGRFNDYWQSWMKDDVKFLMDQAVAIEEGQTIEYTAVTLTGEAINDERAIQYSKTRMARKLAEYMMDNDLISFKITMPERFMDAGRIDVACVLVKRGDHIDTVVRDYARTQIQISDVKD